jgi:hypothetical protein
MLSRGSSGNGGNNRGFHGVCTVSSARQRRGNSGNATDGKGKPAAVRERIDFAAVNAATLRELPRLLARWLPDGRLIGREWTARNPRRADRHPGSFRVNLRSGRWADFATADRGGDPVSLAAFLFGLSQVDAACRLAAMLGVAPGGARP